MQHRSHPTNTPALFRADERDHDIYLRQWAALQRPQRTPARVKLLALQPLWLVDAGKLSWTTLSNVRVPMVGVVSTSTQLPRNAFAMMRL